MNARTTRLFVAIHENIIVRVDTTIRGFARGFSAIEPTFMHHLALFRKFKQVDRFELWIEGKKYYFEAYTQEHEKRKPSVKKEAISA